MAYIRTKRVKGKLYRYEVEGYRDPQTGKVKQRILRYLGAAQDLDPDVPADVPQKLGTTTTADQFQPCRITLHLNGEDRPIDGRVVLCMTNGVNGPIAHTAPGVTCVEYEYDGARRVVQVPSDRVTLLQLLTPPAPAGHGEDLSRVQLPLTVPE